MRLKECEKRLGQESQRTCDEEESMTLTHFCIGMAVSYLIHVGPGKSLLTMRKCSNDEERVYFVTGTD